MSDTLRMQAFLTGKSFKIPSYQRDYAWTMEEVNDLLSDIQESLDTSTHHYLGTIVLAKVRGNFEIVDGQQRLSTLMLLLHALLSQLEISDPIRIADEIYLLKHGRLPKLDFGANQAFVVELFSSTNPGPETRGQRRLADAYRCCHERAQALRSSGMDNIYLWLDAIKSLEIIAFYEENTGRAIRIFQSVNDRGRQLSDMDKAKALLVLYSNRFLDGSLDTEINESFGSCFASYDRIREQATQYGYKIDLIDRSNFSENDLLRYHYLAYDAAEASDYYGYSKTIIDHFLKPVLRERKTDAASLRSFISDYINDLKEFAESFAALVNSTRSSNRLFTLLVVHGLAARLYPIAIRMFQRNLLFVSVPGTAPSVDLLHCLETVDLRVYKIRGTDPARDIGHLSHASRTATVAAMAERLRAFLLSFMPDSLMATHLGGRVYKSGAAVPILLAFEQNYTGHAHPMETLVALVQQGPTQEHILSQEPSFDCTSRGFTGDAEFEEYLDRIGNLSLLTSSENTRCHNKSVELKMSQQDLYPSSSFSGPRFLAQEFSVSGAMFGKQAVINRTERLIKFALSKWAIW